jgi:hypothetical protein
MMNLVATLTLMLQALAPKVNGDRVSAISSDMIEVVEADANNEPRLDSKTSLAMLAAAAVGESGLLESAEACKATGDGGKSVGLGQVMRGPNWEGHSRKEICSDRKLQLKLSLHVLKKCWSRTPTPRSVFRCYTSGDAAVGSYVASSEHKIFVRIKNALDTSPVIPALTFNVDSMLVTVQ